MATYKEIQKYIKGKFGFATKSCWIADIKDKFGLITRKAPNRIGVERLYPCPPNKKDSLLRLCGILK